MKAQKQSQEVSPQKASKSYPGILGKLTRVS